MSNKIVREQVLPVRLDKNYKEVDKTEYIFEPSKEEVLNQVIRLNISYTLFRIILDAKTSEHASRMNAMKNASDNAKEIEEKLKSQEIEFENQNKKDKDEIERKIKEKYENDFKTQSTLLNEELNKKIKENKEEMEKLKLM